MNKINEIERIDVGGLLFHKVDMKETIEKIEIKIKQYSKNSPADFVLVANQDILNQIGRIKELNIDKLNESFLIIPDGYSIIYAAKFLKTPLKERVAGPDLMLEFIKLSEKKGYKNFFLGAKEGVAEKMSERFLTEFRDLSITGAYSPPFCSKFSEDENKKIIDTVNQSNSDVLWVSFGCPKQEMWIIENRDEIRVPVVIGVGAAFDFHSGNVKRAPKFIQNMRLEWFYRILQEPGRLWKRYFVGGLDFIKLIRRQKKRQKNTSKN